MTTIRTGDNDRLVIEGMVPGTAYVLHHTTGEWPPTMTEHRIVVDAEAGTWSRMTAIDPPVFGLDVPPAVLESADSDAVLFVRWANGALGTWYYSRIFRNDSGLVDATMGRPHWASMARPVQCDDCRETFERGTHLRDMYARCVSCDTYHCPTYTVGLCNECGEYSCNYDRHCDSSDDPGMADYRHVSESTRLDGSPVDQARGPRYAGIEVEAEGYGADFGALGGSIPRRCGISTDGSLNNGIEVQTPPARGEALVDVVTRVCDALISNGFDVEDSCGLHVHLDLTDRKTDRLYLSRLYGAFYAVEPMLFALQVDQHNRGDSGYCAPLRQVWPYDGPAKMARKSTTDIFSDWYGIDSAYDRDEREEQVHHYGRDKYNDTRYRSVNFHSVVYRGTLEVRIHEGTLNSRDILAWTDLLQSVLVTCDKRWPGYKRLRLLAEDDYKGIADLFDFTPATRAYMTRRLRANNLIEETEVI